MKNLLNFILLILLIFLQSCSSSSLGNIGYRYGDWLLKKRILKYVKLYSPQQDKLDVILDDYMSWHKLSMLQKYQKEIEHIQRDTLKSKSLDTEVIFKHLTHIRELYYESFYGLTDRIAPVLTLLGDQQVRRTQKILNDNLDEIKENAKVKLGQLQLETRDSWNENIEDWIGPLSNEQREIIKKHSLKLMIHPKKKMAVHGSRIQRFISLYDDEVKKDERVSQLKGFFRSWSKGNRYENWRRDLSSLIAQIHASLNTEQKAHLKDKLKQYHQLLKSLQEN